MAPVLARAAIAAGIGGLFIETHENPDKALSDGPNTIALRDMKSILSYLKEYDSITKDKITDYYTDLTVIASENDANNAVDINSLKSVG